jgi:hypothetical protein
MEIKIKMKWNEKMYYAVCCYAKRRYVECRYASVMTPPKVYNIYFHLATLQTV